jgi:hypothetical protein
MNKLTLRDVKIIGEDPIIRKEDGQVLDSCS